MRGVVAVASALFVSALLSGCFVEDKEPETEATDGSETQTTDGSGTSGTRSATTTGAGSGTATANRQPMANLTADPVNGTAPLNVTFAVSGSDPDGGALDWTLTLGNTTLGSGNGTTLPSNVTHQFTQAGDFRVVLTVTDGLLNASANVTVTVAAGGDGAGAGAVEEDDWVVFNADGTCDAKGEIGLGPLYVHERGDPPGTGYVNGAGTWLYEESNGVEGLQVGGAGPLGGEAAEYAACLNPDSLIF